MSEQLLEGPKIGNDPAFPTEWISRNSYGDIRERTTVPGLTKRELFAAMAMQGLLSNWEALARMGFKSSEVEKFAIDRADALLKGLSK